MRMRLLFKNLTSVDLAGALSASGLTEHAARKIQGAVFRKGAIPASLAEVSGRMLGIVRSTVRIPDLSVVRKVVSPVDGFARYVFKGEGDGEFEAVRIPLMHRPGDEKYVVCVSSQVGCGLGCAFCMTGKMGFVRNLEAWEIVDQVMKIRDDSSYPVRGVVFMGMGEPMLNYDEVMRAARILCEPCGMAISAKSITVSTAGIIPGIERFTAEKVQYRLVVSLTAADHEKRALLMPVEKKYPLSALVPVLREYNLRTRERVILAWTMISGVNTSEGDVRLIAELFSGIPIKLDLIDVNDPDCAYLPPSKDELSLFRGYIKRILDTPMARRYSGGYDIRAACGMLGSAG